MIKTSSRFDRRNTFVDVTDRASLLGIRQKSDMMVLLERDDGRYTAGETIRGRVHIILTQDVTVTDLVLRFTGNSHVSWNEAQTTYIKGSAPTVSCRNKETFLDFSLSLLNKDNSDVKPATPTSVTSSLSVPDADDNSDLVLSAGNYGFQFDYTLPRDLPSSFEGRWGSVRYSVSATLKRPDRFDIERDAQLTVSAYVDLNDDSATDLARPIGGLGEFNPGLMCFRGGPISVELRVCRRGYVSGDRIQLSADVENTSSFRLRHCRIALMQHVTYRAGQRLRKTTTDITTIDKEDVLARTTARWHNDSICVPDNLPPSSAANRLQRSIDIKYTVAVVLSCSRWSSAFILPVTVVIGTVALRRHTAVNSYLSAMFSVTAPPLTDTTS